MEILGISIQGSVKPNIRILAVPVILAVVLAILTLLIGQRGISQIASKLKDLQEAKKAETGLEARTNVLQRLEGVVLSQADVSRIALPEKDPSLLMLGQVKSILEKHNLEIKGIRTRRAAKLGKEIAVGQVSFNVSGELENVLEFLKEIKTFAPISTLEGVSIIIEGSQVSVNTTLFIFWSGFPTEIPAITTPINELSTEEKALLEKVTRLTKPEFNNLNPTEPSNRQDPFN